MKTKILTLISAAALITTTASAISVGVELALVVDVSSSIDADEYTLQKSGYEAAFRNSDLQNLIAATPGGVAVSYTEFATNQATRINWTQITDASSSNAFADMIAGLTRITSGIGGLTEIAGAIDFVSATFAGNGFEGDRNVIDVSGDGKDNRRDNGNGTFTVADANLIANNPIQANVIFDEAQVQVEAARAAALLAGITTINGLPVVIPGDVDNEGLAEYYAMSVIGGTDAFSTVSTSFQTIETSILEKITTEIKIPDPVPDTGTTAALLGFGLLALGAIRRRMKH